MVEIDVPELEILEKLHATKAKSDDEEFVDVEDDTDNIEELRKALHLLLETRTLLEFLGNPDFCKNITKRERGAIDRHLEKIYACIDALNETVSEADEEAEEEDV